MNSSAGVDDRVTLIMPTLNARRFLEERLQSIAQQSHRSWQLKVFDSGSEDGTAEEIRSHFGNDSRVVIEKVPRLGVYDAINRGLAGVETPFMAIMTADDTMDDDFLERTLAALQSCPQCGTAVTPLRMIDPRGNVVADIWSDSVWTHSAGSFGHLPHQRLAPLDGVLHVIGQSVIPSLTQCLFRRPQEGFTPFALHYGSFGDFAWQLARGLEFNAVYVPSTSTSFRLHPDQLTRQSMDDPRAAQRCIQQMLDEAMMTLKNNQFRKKRQLGELMEQTSRDLQAISATGRGNPTNCIGRAAAVILSGYRRPASLRLRCIRRFGKPDAIERHLAVRLRKKVDRLLGQPAVQAIPTDR